VAAASRTDAPDLAREMLKLLKVPTKPVQLPPSGSTNTAKAIEFFDHIQIFPGSKMAHFEQLRRETGIAYERMIFFDDESRNKEVEDLGVVMYLARQGITNDEVDKGVLSWRKRNRREVA
jgi:magnesium-dependent phosphatase 1